MTAGADLRRPSAPLVISQNLADNPVYGGKAESALIEPFIRFSAATSHLRVCSFALSRYRFVLAIHSR